LNSKRILLIACTLSILLSSMLFILPSKVHATSITINPASGIIGSQISLSGEGFIGKLASIYWDEKKIIQNVPITKQGQINYTFEIPSASKGAHVVKVTDDSNWSTITASLNFMVTPSITMEPPWGKPTNTITIIGNGFAPNETGIKTFFASNPLSKTPIVADKTGSWHSILTVPDLPKGEYTVGASGDGTQPGETPEIVFTIAPYCKATPLSGPVGTRVTISGVGFRAGEDGITFTWDGPIIDTNFVARPNGSFSYDIVVPPSVKGRHIIGIYGSSFTPKNIVPDIEFEVTPTISIVPSDLFNSKDLTINGAGYNAGEVISVTYDNANTNKTSTTDALGSFKMVIQSLPTPGKNHTIVATGSKGAVAQATYVSTVVAPAAPQLLYPGPGAKIQTYNSVLDVIFSIFKYVGGIFDSFTGSQQKINDQVLTAMNWAASPDQTGLKYTLQISKSEDFSAVVLLKESITATTYQINKSSLPLAGSYYWRVKATNDSGLSSPWSNTWKFDVIAASPLIFTISIVIIILALAIIVFAIIAIINRNRAKA
jgi:hypothetical protein